MLRYNPLHNRDELAEPSPGVIDVTVQQALVQRNLAAAVNLDNQDPEDDELSHGKFSDEEWVRQQDKDLEKIKEGNDVATIQRITFCPHHIQA